jgi:hypothetical protein
MNRLEQAIELIMERAVRRAQEGLPPDELSAPTKPSSSFRNANLTTKHSSRLWNSEQPEMPIIRPVARLFQV